jgi:hypothetical protein
MIAWFRLSRFRTVKNCKYSQDLDKPKGDEETSDGSGEECPSLDLFEVIARFDRNEWEEDQCTDGA